MLLGVIAEYAALSVMVPLGGGSNIKAASAGFALILNGWNSIISFLNLNNNPNTWFWIFLLLLGIRIFIALMQVILNSYVSKKIHAQLSSSTFKSVVGEVPMNEIYKHSIGYYMGLAGDDSIRVGQLLYSVLQTVSALLAALIGLLVLYLFSEYIFLLTILFLLISGILLSGLMRRLIALSRSASTFGKEASTTFIEALNGLRSIRTMGGEFYVGKRYMQVVSTYAGVLFSIDAINHSSRTVPGLILLAGALIYLFPQSEPQKEISIVYLFALTTLLVRVLSFLSTAVFSAGKAATEIRAIRDLKELLKIDKIKLKPRAVKNINSIKRIKTSSLCCGYSKDSVLLQDINIELIAGNSYALMGGSGSGKSTFCDVMLGLMPPLYGDFFIDDVSYSELDLNQLRRRVILVEQQTRIFSGTIRDNIAFGLSVTDCEINEAIRHAGLEELISSLPYGINSNIEYQGSNLSGGQCQRIGVARALLRKPDLLILDEATSALDAFTRNILVENLLKLFSENIIIFVTHDPHISSCVNQVWKIQKSQIKIEIIQ